MVLSSVSTAHVRSLILAVTSISTCPLHGVYVHGTALIFTHRYSHLLDGTCGRGKLNMLVKEDREVKSNVDIAIAYFETVRVVR